MMVQAAGRYQVDVVFSGLIVFAALSLVHDRDGAAPGEPAQPLAAAADGRASSDCEIVHRRLSAPAPQQQVWLSRPSSLRFGSSLVGT